MKVIWKRPDGFHEASPKDFTVVEIANKSKLWLHRLDQENYPFRVSGGWQDENSTVKLNRLVNLLSCDYDRWLQYLSRDFHDSKVDTIETYCSNLTSWLQELSNNLKGDTWETDIMTQTFDEIHKTINALKDRLKNDLLSHQKA